MDTLSYKTISANKATVTKEWVIVDATDQTLGRLGAKVAKLLRGKYKPNFTPHVDCGDNVIIINADKVKLTGNKWNDRVYLSYTCLLYTSGYDRRGLLDWRRCCHLSRCDDWQPLCDRSGKRRDERYS